MPTLSETYITSVGLIIQAVDKIHQVTGTREDIAKSSTAGGAAIPNIPDTAPSNVSESGKGIKLSIHG